MRYSELKEEHFPLFLTFDQVSRYVVFIHLLNYRTAALPTT